MKSGEPQILKVIERERQLRTKKGNLYPRGCYVLDQEKVVDKTNSIKL